MLGGTSASNADIHHDKTCNFIMYKTNPPQLYAKHPNDPTMSDRIQSAAPTIKLACHWEWAQRATSIYINLHLCSLVNRICVLECST